MGGLWQAFRNLKGFKHIVFNAEGGYRVVVLDARGSTEALFLPECFEFSEHDYQSVRQLQGSMSQKNCADPAAFKRAQYMRAIMSYKQ